jgi:amino acid permease
MVQNIFKTYIYPVAVLCAATIGVGFLSLPYIALQVSLPLMLVYFFALASVVMIVHVVFSQVCLKTPDYRRWPGFVEFYFGRAAKMAIMPFIIMGVFGVMLVYLVIGSQFLHAALSSVFGGSQLYYALAYWAFTSTFIFFGVRAVSKFDFWALLLLVGALVFIAFEGAPYMKLANLGLGSVPASFSGLFLPYGPILFALWGTGLIPEAEEMVRGHKRSLKSIVITASLIPAALYLAFMILVLAISGNATTESALVGIQHVLGDGVMGVILCIGVMTTMLAFVAEGLLLKKIFIYDAKLRHAHAFLWVAAIPLVLFLLGFHSFIPLISFIGGALLGIEGILIMFMYRKIGGSVWIVYPLVVVFLAGILYSILHFSV